MEEGTRIVEDSKIIKIPTIMAFINPFSVVVRGNEEWKPTLDEINESSYDYVKLNRTSTAIDIGIAPLSMIVGFDGSLILPCIKEYADVNKAVEKFNETLGYLLLGGIYVKATSPEDISFGYINEYGYSKIVKAGDGQLSSFHFAIRSRCGNPFESIRLMEPQIIKDKDLIIAYRKGQKIFQKLSNISPSVLIQSASYYVSKQYTESLIFSWTTIEKIVNLIWDKEVIAKDDGNISARKTLLKDFRTWTNAVRMDVLFQLHLLPTELYSSLTLTRKTRNNFMHNQNAIKSQHAEVALKSLMQLISLIDSDFKTITLLNDVLDKIVSKTELNMNPTNGEEKGIEPQYWMYDRAPIPGDKEWGTKDFEKIEEIMLKPLNKQQ